MSISVAGLLQVACYKDAKRFGVIKFKDLKKPLAKFILAMLGQCFWPFLEC